MAEINFEQFFDYMEEDISNKGETENSLSVMRITLCDLEKVNDNCDKDKASGFLNAIQPLIDNFLSKNEIVTRISDYAYCVYFSSQPYRYTLKLARLIRQGIQHHTFNSGNDIINLDADFKIIHCSSLGSDIKKVFHLASKDYNHPRQVKAGRITFINPELSIST